MAKYYVTSNLVRTLVEAADAEGAALWALHQTLTDSVESSGDSSTNRIGFCQTIADDEIDQAFVTWGETVLVSEQGFDHDDSGIFQLPDLLQSYCDLTAALEALSAVGV